MQILRRYVRHLMISRHFLHCQFTNFFSVFACCEGVIAFDGWNVSLLNVQLFIGIYFITPAGWRFERFNGNIHLSYMRFALLLVSSLLFTTCQKQQRKKQAKTNFNHWHCKLHQGEIPKHHQSIANCFFRRKYNLCFLLQNQLHHCAMHLQKLFFLSMYRLK